MKEGGNRNANICVKIRSSLVFCKITTYLGWGKKVITNKKEMSKAGIKWVLKKEKCAQNTKG